MLWLFYRANTFSRITFIRSKININRVCKLIATGYRRRLYGQGKGGGRKENIGIDIRKAEISVNTRITDIGKPATSP